MPQQMPTVSTSEGDEQGGLVPRKDLSGGEDSRQWGRWRNTRPADLDTVRKGNVDRIPHLCVQHADAHRCVRYEVEVMGEGSKARPAKCVVHREQFPKGALEPPEEGHAWLIPLVHDVRFTGALRELFDHHNGPLTLVLTAVYDADHGKHSAYDAHRITCWLRIPNRRSTAKVAAV